MFKNGPGNDAPYVEQYPFLDQVGRGGRLTNGGSGTNGPRLGKKTLKLWAMASGVVHGKSP
jgi:hypothetical protein